MSANEQSRSELLENKASTITQASNSLVESILADSVPTGAILIDPAGGPTHFCPF